MARHGGDAIPQILQHRAGSRPLLARAFVMLPTREEGAVKRLLVAAASTLSLAVLSLSATPAAMASGYLNGKHPTCEQNAVTCTEVYQPVGRYYTGHDEPSLLFYSRAPGSGNNDLYRLTLPTDPPRLPVQNGTGGTFNFQLHPAFWFGMAMCDDQSAPNPGGSSVGPNVPCTPDSDANIYNSPDLSSPRYIGLHPGTAFMEMQFYPPGWAPWPAGNSCAATQWCAALNIDSLSENMNTGQTLNPTCASVTGLEYVNFAFITKNGVAQAPANPVDATLATYTPNPAQDLFMNSGDRLRVAMRDTSSGFRVVIHDLTTGQTGSMTASAANGFGEVQFAPSPSTSCTNIPTNFHPMYSTSGTATRVPWAAHSYNVAFSDEIGHFEYCNGVNPTTGACNSAGVNDPTGLDSDDVACFSPAQSTRVRIGGCLGSDLDFDGVPYQKTWPGTLPSSVQDALVHPSPIRFTSPLFNGTHNYSQVAFEADLSRIEPTCQRFISNPASPSPGTGCVNPPPGAAFYPFYSTTAAGGHCRWQLGGPFIPGTSNNFGGSSTTEFGSLLALFYPQFASAGPPATTLGPSYRYNDFRRILSTNPCPA
jgi:hypothetical protein